MEIGLFSKNKILYVLARLGLVIILLTCLTPDDDSIDESLKQKCKDNHICYELVEVVSEYTEKDENQVYDFFYMVSDDEMDLGDAIRYIDSSLSDREIENLLNKAAEMEKTSRQ